MDDSDLNNPSAVFRLLFDQHPQGILFLDGVGSVQYANPSALNILNLTQDELLFSLPEKFIHLPDSGPDITFQLTGNTAVPARLKLPNQNEIPVIARMIPTDQFEDGYLIFFSPANSNAADIDDSIATQYGARLTREIQKRRQAEQALRESEELARKGFDILPDPIILWKKYADGTIRMHHTNQAVEGFSKGTIPQYLGMTLEEFFSHNLEIANIIHEVFQTGCPRRIEMPYKMRSTDEQKWLLVDYILVNETLLFNIIHDITDKKNQEIKDKIYQQRLELLRQAMTEFTSTHNLELILEKIFTYLKQLLDFDTALIFIEENEWMVLSAANGGEQYHALVGTAIPLDNPQSQLLSARQSPVYLSDAQNFKPFLQLEQLNPGRAWLGAPLSAHGQMIGYLSIYSNQPNQFNQDEAEFVQVLTNEAAIAIENARLFTKIQQMAIYDDLTKIHNRRYFLEIAEIEFQHARRYNKPLTMLMVDIDHFKEVNDRYGHQAGDHVLANLAHKFRSSLRTSDLLGRYGGEEFIILLPETKPPEAIEAAERLRTIAEEIITHFAGQEICITVSIGAAELIPVIQNMDDLLRKADLALYMAKQTGRNKVQY